MSGRRAQSGKFFIVLLSIHGLVRGTDLELGRDADTGGQVKYVVELLRALGERPEVERAVLLTRRVVDSQVSADYARRREPISSKASIVRIDCGEEKYLRKELLWDSLDNFADNAIAFLKKQKRIPDIIHSHYADAGYVGAKLAHQLGIPLVHTGHSLGRSKRLRLLASGIGRGEIEDTYKISRRIEAEETTLGAAERVITSTRQEIDEQYGLYDFYQPERMLVIPPGTDLTAFHPSRGDEKKNLVARNLRRFLKKPDKPMILALSRPDPKKNISGLLESYGESAALQRAANLVIVAGNRDDISDMDEGAHTVLRDMLLAIDRYDLYGHVAYPKHHQASDVPAFFRLAAALKGVFVNPALTEPFGLTLLEAAACGLPIAATEDGGPVDIIKNCRNGCLIDPLNTESMAQSILKMLTDATAWDRFAQNGLQGVVRHYSWPAHVEKYLSMLQPLVEKTASLPRLSAVPRRSVARKQALFAGLDLSLIVDQKSLVRLLQCLHIHRKILLFGITTGRRLDGALATLRKYNIPQPDVLISGQGTEIHYAPNLLKDDVWEQHINHLWDPGAVRKALKEVPGISLQPKVHQNRFKVSYYVDTAVTTEREIRQILLRADVTANVFVSFGQFLDILPLRASKGFALRWCAEHLDFPLENTLVAGVTGADADMLRGNTLGTVVDNRHRGELSDLETVENIYFSNAPGAEGILEAMTHYDFPTEKSGS